MKGGSFGKREFEIKLKRAESGDPASAASVGCFYREGYGTKKDLKQAFVWLKEADDAMEAYGSFNLAEMYDSGEGIEVNYNEAFRLFMRAVEFDKSGYAGLRDSMRIAIAKRLSEMYREGIGTSKNEEYAIRWEAVYKERTENVHEFIGRKLNVI